MTAGEAQLFDAIAESPRFFIEEVLGERLDPQQVEVCERFKRARRISVKSGHSCGKDFLAARLALWYHIVHYPSIVVTTGPTDRQVQNIVWGEIRAAYKNARFPIGGELLPSASLLRSDHPKHYMIGFTSDDPNAYQGLHAPHVLIVVTEAQGVHPTLWPGIESLMTAVDAKLLLIGNAIYEPGSEFYSTFTDKAALYTGLTLDSVRSSHCSRKWIEEVKEIYGENSSYYRARVGGEFPTDVSDALIPLGWIERAKARWEQYVKNTHQRHGPECVLGCDVARFGTDHTVFYHGYKNHFWCDHDRQGQDLMETAGHVKRRSDDGIPPPQIRLDDTGLGGGVTDRCREQKVRITAINFGSKAKDEEHYQNARTEMYFNLRERFRLGDIAIDPQDKELVRDLSVIKMKQLSNGQVKIEDKAEQKRKLGYSPDRADALALAALPQALALDLETGGVPARGLLEFYAQLTEKKDAKPPQPVAVRPASEIPGASALMAGGKA